MILGETFPTKIVALEGIDGAGKTSCCEALCDRLSQRGLSVYCTGEFKSDIGDWLAGQISSLSFVEKILYFAADRSSALEKARLHDAELIVWDRYVLSAFAYRLAEVIRLNRVAEWEQASSFIQMVNSCFPTPVLTIWLRLPPDQAIIRKSGDLERLGIVDQAYAKLFREYQSPWIEVNASPGLEEVIDALDCHVSRLLS